MNRQQIRAKARKALHETTASFWTDVEIDGYIENACDDLAKRARCIRTNGFMTITAETGEYVLSVHFPTLIAVTEVYFKKDGTTWDDLDPTSREQLNALHPGWKSATSGTPSEYYWNKEEDLIGFYVKPNSANAGSNYAQVYFARTHTDIAGDETVIDIPEDLHDAIVEYVVATGSRDRGYGDNANDSWQKYFTHIHDYLVGNKVVREDEEIVMKSIYNL